MGKKMTKKETEGLIYLVLIALAIGAVGKFFQVLGFWGSAILVIAGLALIVLIQSEKKKKRLRDFEERKEHLLGKYGDEDLVKRIMDKTVWVGQSEDQLIDALGTPEDMDQKVLKTKIKEIWKYYHQGGRRYGLRITLDNGEVVGWDDKM